MSERRGPHRRGEHRAAAPLKGDDSEVLSVSPGGGEAAGCRRLGTRAAGGQSPRIEAAPPCGRFNSSPRSGPRAFFLPVRRNRRRLGNHVSAQEESQKVTQTRAISYGDVIPTHSRVTDESRGRRPDETPGSAPRGSEPCAREGWPGRPGLSGYRGAFFGKTVRRTTCDTTEESMNTSLVGTGLGVLGLCVNSI